MVGRRRGSRGFTLVELMIVVSCIGVLATIAIPGFLGAKARARRSELLNEADSMKLILRLYFRLNGKFPTMPFTFCSIPGYGGPIFPGCSPPGTSLDFRWDVEPFKTLAQATNAPLERTRQRHLVYSFSNLFYLCIIHDFNADGTSGATCFEMWDTGTGDLSEFEWENPVGSELE